MNGYDLYGIYQAIKLHFQSEKYNFFLYDGKTRVSVDAFQKRKDKYFFHRLARKYKDEEIVSFLVANFVHGDNAWSKSLLEEDAEEVFREWRKVTESMTEVFKNDLARIIPEKNARSFNGLFEVVNGNHPKLLTLYMQHEVSIETLVILNNILNFINIWDKKISDDVIYPKISLKIRKYGAFLNVNVDKYKALLKSYLTSE